jgi:hypothetical protein
MLTIETPPIVVILGPSDVPSTQLLELPLSWQLADPHKKCGHRGTNILANIRLATSMTCMT